MQEVGFFLPENSVECGPMAVKIQPPILAVSIGLHMSCNAYSNVMLTAM
jgi:hypothetical protein